MFDNIWPYLFLHQTAHSSLISSPIWLIQLKLQKYDACPWSDKYLVWFAGIYFYVSHYLSSCLHQVFQLRQIHMIKQIFGHVYFSSKCLYHAHLITNCIHLTGGVQIWDLPIKQTFGYIWPCLFLHQTAHSSLISSPIWLIQLELQKYEACPWSDKYLALFGCICFYIKSHYFTSGLQCNSFNWDKYIWSNKYLLIFGHVCFSSKCLYHAHLITNWINLTGAVPIWDLPIVRQTFGYIWPCLFLYQTAYISFISISIWVI
jgi:hypothetical protein